MAQIAPWQQLSEVFNESLQRRVITQLTERLVVKKPVENSDFILA